MSSERGVLGHAISVKLVSEPIVTFCFGIWVRGVVGSLDPRGLGPRGLGFDSKLCMRSILSMAFEC